MSAEKLDTTQRREQLAYAALGVIAERGLKGLSVAAVARRAGLVPSALYRHFRSKDELLNEVVSTVRARLQENIRLADRSGDQAIPALRKIILRHAALIRENPALPRVLFSDEIHIGAPRRRAIIHGVIREYLEALADFIRRGQRAGQIRAELDPGDTALMCLGLMQPPALLWLLSGGNYDAAQQIERAWRVFSTRILAPENGPPRAGKPPSRAGRS